MRTLPLSLLVLSLSGHGPVAAQVPTVGAASDDLAAGIRYVEEGDLEAAVIALDTAVQRLKQENGREKDLATAHLYLAMAHLGLSQWERAKGEMREAWRNDKKMTLDRKKFPPRVIQLYEETRQEAGRAEAAPPPPPPTVPSPATTAAPPKKGGSKVLPILIGVGAVAGAGVALAAGGGDASSPAPPPPPPSTPPNQPTGAVTADLRLNGQNGGSFSCQAGLFFTVTVSNTTQQSARVERFDLDFAVVSGACKSHTPAGMDGSAVDARDVPAGATVQIRRVDLAGSLCSPPNGGIGCEWNGRLVVTTSGGRPSDELRFSTSP